MKIFAINLASAVDRLADMKRQLDGLGLRFERVDATLGISVSQVELEKFENHSTMQLSHGELGCALSHLACWNMLIDSDDEAALVFEDDICISFGLTQLILKLEIPNVPSIIKLETRLTSITVSRPLQIIENYKLFEMYSKHAGTAAYIINRKAAHILSKNLYKTSRPVDIYMFDLEENINVQIGVYQIVPAPCIQWDVLDPTGIPKHQQSMIGNEREVNSTGFREKKRGSIEKILLPLYLWFYSFILLFKKQKRIDVRYR